MTDIRKDFEVFAKTKDMPLAKIVNNLGKTVYKNWCVQDAFEGFQAGRAHDIDGLIAEILNAVAANEDDDCTINIQTLVPIIRKHFGKE